MLAPSATQAKPISISETRTPETRDRATEVASIAPRWQEKPTLVRPGWYGTGKVIFDFLLALMLSVLFFPVLVAAALLVKLTSRGPVLYSQLRLGRNGRPFSIYKLRTMYQNCEATSGACWSRPGDPRVTPLGRLLRATHVDELPQLWNILCGDMSLVGPRPERPEFVPALEQAIPRYRDRLLVRPGITGLAQVQLPPDVDIAGVRTKVAHDLYYLRHFSCWLDARILICTIFHVFGLPCHELCRMLLRTQREPLPSEKHEISHSPSRGREIVT